METQAQGNRQWRNEVRLIPTMVRMYCHHYHGTKKKELCSDCQELLDYSLYRLSKCPFKAHKKFCSTCKVHCYVPAMQEKMGKVMRYSGPRMVFAHPVFAFSHAFQMLSAKRKAKKEAKEASGVR